MTERCRQPANLREKFGLIREHWSPGVIAQVNDYHVKIAKVQGEFVWHTHEDSDELFLVHRGTLTIEFPDGEVTLREGELYVVPKGTAHRPVAREECEIMMFEPAGTRNTGDSGGDLTVENPSWL